MKSISAADTAKLVRRALANQFPAIKFSVGSKTYPGGASIEVRWTDGPTTGQVNPVAKRFEGADFNGMIDLKTYRSHYLLSDGTTIIAHQQGTEGSRGTIPEVDNRLAGMPEGLSLEGLGGAGREEVRFGSDFVFCRRDVSDFEPRWPRQWL